MQKRMADRMGPDFMMEEADLKQTARGASSLAQIKAATAAHAQPRSADLAPCAGKARHESEVQEDLRAPVAGAALGVVGTIRLDVRTQRLGLAHSGGDDLIGGHAERDELSFHGLGTSL